MDYELSSNTFARGFKQIMFQFSKKDFTFATDFVFFGDSQVFISNGTLGMIIFYNYVIQN